jgi:hypothetical protein
MVASEAPSPPADVDNPICLAESIPILNERPFIDVPDSEVDRVVLTASPWKAPDRYGLQMGHVQRAWPVIAEWVRELFKLSVRLGAKPTPFKANVATPTPAVPIWTNSKYRDKKKALFSTATSRVPTREGRI